MKIMVNTKLMKESIKDLNKVKGTNIYIKALENKINIFTNNHLTQLKKVIPGDIIEKGSTTFSNNVGKLMMKFKEGEMLIEDNDISCKNKKLEFIPEKFKTMERENLKNEYTIETEELLRLLEVDYCISKEEIRPALKGVCFKNNQACALDGYRLSLRTSEKIDFNAEFLVSGESIKILKSILNPKTTKQVKISLFENHILFAFNNYELTCKLLEERFVNFNSLIPKTNVEVNKIKINNVEYLKQSLSLAKETYADKKERAFIKLLCNDNELKIENIDYNIKYSDIIEESEYISNGCDMIVFDINYMEALLKNNKYQNLTISFINGVSPVIFSENFDMNNLELILPVRLSKIK